MGRLFLIYAEKEDSVYVCRCCFTHLSTSEQIISKVSVYANVGAGLKTFFSSGLLNELEEVETKGLIVPKVLQASFISCFLKDHMTPSNTLRIELSWEDGVGLPFRQSVCVAFRQLVVEISPLAPRNGSLATFCALL